MLRECLPSTLPHKSCVAPTLPTRASIRAEILSSCRARPQNGQLMPANRRVHAHALFLALSNPCLADHNPLVRRPICVRRIAPHHVGERCPAKRPGWRRCSQCKHCLRP